MSNKEDAGAELAAVCLIKWELKVARSRRRYSIQRGRWPRSLNLSGSRVGGAEGSSVATLAADAVALPGTGTARRGRSVAGNLRYRLAAVVASGLLAMGGLSLMVGSAQAYTLSGTLRPGEVTGIYVIMAVDVGTGGYLDASISGEYMNNSQQAEYGWWCTGGAEASMKRGYTIDTRYFNFSDGAWAIGPFAGPGECYADVGSDSDGGDPISDVNIYDFNWQYQSPEPTYNPSASGSALMSAPVWPSALPSCPADIPGSCTASDHVYHWTVVTSQGLEAGPVGIQLLPGHLMYVSVSLAYQGINPGSPFVAGNGNNTGPGMSFRTQLGNVPVLCGVLDEWQDGDQCGQYSHPDAWGHTMFSGYWAVTSMAANAGPTYMYSQNMFDYTGPHYTVFGTMWDYGLYQPGAPVPSGPAWAEKPSGALASINDYGGGTQGPPTAGPTGWPGEPVGSPGSTSGTGGSSGGKGVPPGGGQDCHVAPLSGECKVGITQSQGMNSCGADVGCLVGNVIAALGNAVGFVVNSLIDLAEPGKATSSNLAAMGGAISGSGIGAGNGLAGAYGSPDGSGVNAGAPPVVWQLPAPLNTSVDVGGSLTWAFTALAPDRPIFEACFWFFIALRLVGWLPGQFLRIPD